MTESKPRGRPRREAVQKLRTQIWYLTLLAEAKEGPRALERRFGGSPTSSEFSKYRLGSVSPTKTVLAKAAIFTAANRSYNHPLWRLLSDGLLSYDELSEAFDYFSGTENQSVFLEENKKYGISWRVDKNLKSQCAAILNIERGEDVLAAYLILLEENFLCRRLKQFEQVVKFWQNVRILLMSKEVFCLSSETALQQGGYKDLLINVLRQLLQRRWREIVQEDSCADWW